MLQQILQEIETAQGAVNLNDLAHKFGLERDALKGMLDFWMRKGRLVELGQDETTSGICSGAACGGSCPGPQRCPFGLNMPRTFTPVSRE